MPICFESCSGSPADVAEIEYIAALFMTCRDMNEQQQQSASGATTVTATTNTQRRRLHLRRPQQEGTVNAVDLRHYLISRHGLKFSQSQIEEQILVHLAGSRRLRRRHDNNNGKRPLLQGGDIGNVRDDDEECPEEERKVQEEDGSNVQQNNNSSNVAVVVQNDNHEDGKDNEEKESSGKKWWCGKFLSKKRSAEEKEKCDEEEEEEGDRLSMDMVQLMSLLFIPELVRIRREKENHHENKNGKENQGDDSEEDMMVIIKAALLSILELAGIEYGAELSMETLQQILRAHGEEHLFEGDDNDANDNDGIALLKEMLASCAQDPSSDIDAAETGTISLTEESILRALTDDIVDCYHLHREDRISTHFQDALYDSPRQLRRQFDKQGKQAGVLHLGGLDDEGNRSGGKHDGKVDGNDDSTLENPALHRMYTASSCDNSADTFQSYWWNILAWATLVITFFAYFVHGFGNIDSTLPNIYCVEPEEDSPFEVYGCQTLRTIITWLQILFRLALLGTFFLFFSTWGNSVWHAPMQENSTALDYQAAQNWHWWRTMFRYSRAIFTNVVGIIVVISTTILSYSFEVRTQLFSTEKTEGDTKLSQYIGSLVLGCILLAVQLGELIRLLSICFRHKLTVSSSSSSTILGKASKAPRNHDVSTAGKCYSSFLRFSRIFASSSARMERALKQAARFKTQRMLHNALSCHVPSSPADILPGVVEHKTQQNDAITQQSPSPELHSSGIANESPTSADDATGGSSKKDVLSIVEIEPNKKAVSCSHVLLNYQYSQRYDFQELGGILWTWKGILWNQRTFLQEEGIWVPSRIAACQLGQWFICFLIPGLYIYLAEKNFLDMQNNWEAMFGYTVGSFFSFFAAISVTISFIPSAVSQILQFRTGVIGSLKDKNFQVYRFAPDQTTLLFGSSFWGIIFTAGVTWSFVGALAYALVWDDIREIVLLILANIIGILVTIALRIIILRCLRSSLYGGFYRRRPAVAVFVSLALECWNLGLSGGYVLIRTTKLMLITIFYLARIDTPLLAPGVGSVFSKIELDTYPIAFRKNLLIHESHRHPYIERIGLLLMLKLRHGPRFGSRAGAAWRILFVLALAPWMRSHRQGSNGRPTSFRDPRRSIHNRKQQQHDQLRQEEPSIDQLLQDNQMLELENEMLRKRTEELTRMLQESMLGSMNQKTSTSNSNRRLVPGLRSSVLNTRRQSSTRLMARSSERLSSASSDRNIHPKWASKYISC